MRVFSPMMIKDENWLTILVLFEFDRDSAPTVDNLRNLLTQTAEMLSFSLSNSSEERFSPVNARF